MAKPGPVPHPNDKPAVIKPLSLSALHEHKKKNPSASYEDRVKGLIHSKSKTGTGTEESPYRPPGMSDEESDFTIDTTKSFFDGRTPAENLKTASKSPKPGSSAGPAGLKLKPMNSLIGDKLKSSQDRRNVPDYVPTKLTPEYVPSKIQDHVKIKAEAGASRSSSKEKPQQKKTMFDSLVNALASKKPPAGVPPPLPRGAAAPPPPPGGAAPPPPPPPAAEAMAAAMEDGDMDSMVMDILADLDQEMTETERLAKAKEKLAAMFVRAQAKAMHAAQGQVQRPGPRSRTQPAPPPQEPVHPAHPEHHQPGAPHRMGPRSRKDVPPEPAYR